MGWNSLMRYGADSQIHTLLIWVNNEGKDVFVMQLKMSYKYDGEHTGTDVHMWYIASNNTKLEL